MKISRIIFTSFFSLIGIFLLSLMFLGFIYKDKTTKSNYETKQIELKTFSHIYMESGCNLNIYSAEKPSLSYLVEIGKDNKKPIYEIKNDTLFISSKHITVKLMIKDLHTIKADSSKLYFSGIDQNSLSVSLTKTKVNFGNGTTILNLNLQLKDQSDVNIWNFNGSEVKMDIENSRCQMSSNSKLKKISGKIGGNSNVKLPKTRRLDLDIDESSSVIMY